MSRFDPENVSINLVESVADVGPFWDWITKGHSFMAYDIETDGLDWVDGKIRLCQFGTLQEGWAVPYEWYAGLVKEALEYLKAHDCLMFGHNVGGFDFTWTRHHTGFQPDWSKVHDSMILAALVDTAGSKALKDLSATYVHACAKIGQKALHDDMHKGNWTWATVPWDLPSYWIYGVLDTILTANLLYELLPIAERLGVMDAYHIERHVEKILHMVSWNGMRVDLDHVNTEHAALEYRMAEIQNICQTQFNLENIGSGPQLADAFLSTGVVLTDKTATGKWAMNKDAINLIEVNNKDHPLIKLVSEYRIGVKYTSYYNQFAQYTHSDGRVHPYYRQMQARTLRMSANDPPIQTIPRPDDERKAKVRQSFIAGEGNSFISADFANVEAKIFACVSPDEGMIQAFEAGMDLHCYTGGLMYNGGVPIEKKDPRRQKSKNSLFTSLFGGGKDVLAITAGIPVDEADATLKLLKKTFPSIRLHTRNVQVEAALQAQEHGGRHGIRLEDGRILRMAEEDDRTYAYSNYSIQGRARMILAQRLAAMDNAGLMDYGVAVVHDEVVFEVPDEMCTDMIPEIRYHMEDWETFRLPITVGIGEPAKNWADCDH